jgi:hypothetical protein
VSLAERFWARVERWDPDECWLWLGCRTSRGYGELWDLIEKKQRVVHRLAYEWLVGPIPDGFHIDHLCRNRLCVNPKHLEPVTSQVNTLRGTGPSALNARKTHCLRGHPLSGSNLGRQRKGRFCLTCDRAYRREWNRRRREQKASA